MSSPKSMPVPARGRLRAVAALLRRPLGLSLGLHALGFLALALLVAPPFHATEGAGTTPVLALAPRAAQPETVPAIVLPELRRVEAAGDIQFDAVPLPRPVDDALPEVAAWLSERLPADAPLRVTAEMLRPRVNHAASAPAPPAVALPTSLPAPAVQPVARAPRTRAAVSGLRRVYTPRLIDYYPLAMRKRGIEGRVMVKVTLDGGGRVLLASVLAGSGHAALDQAGLRLIRATRFVATGRRVVGKLPVHFRLQ